MIRWISATLAAVLVATSALAIDDERAFEDPVLNERYRSLINELRCPKCQNESIADSNAPIAADLRQQVRTRMAAGESDDEIRQFLVTRYGNFITYRPPLMPTTWALWGGPAALLLIGGIVFYRVVRERAAQPIEEDDEA
jgi:cytochrome c-type biogenesis protein CcmH